jgi:hypothetical protein
MRRTILLVLVSILWAAAARAQGQGFTGQTEWEAAAGGASQLEDLEAVPPGALVLGTNDAGLVDIVLSGDTASGNAIVDAGTVNGSRELSGTVTTNVGSSTTLTLVFPQPVIGFAASFSSASTGNLLTVSTKDADYRLADFGVNTGFFGIVEDCPFSEVVLTSPFESFQMDDLRFVSGVEVFTGRAAWDAANSGSTPFQEDFETVPAGALVLGANGAGLVDIVLSGDTTSGNAIVDTGAVNGSRELSGTVTTNVGSSTTLTLVLPQPTTAFGADFASASTGNLLTLSTDAGDYRLADFGVNTGFFGVVERCPFSQVVLASPFESFQMDDVSFVPEPGATAAGLAALVALGLLGGRRAW